MCDGLLSAGSPVVSVDIELVFSTFDDEKYTVHCKTNDDILSIKRTLAVCVCRAAMHNRKPDTGQRAQRWRGREALTDRLQPRVVWLCDTAKRNAVFCRESRR